MGLKYPRNFMNKSDFEISSIGFFVRYTKIILITDYNFDYFKINKIKYKSSFDIILRFMEFTIKHYGQHLKITKAMSKEIERKMNTSMENKYLVQMFNLSESLIYYQSSLALNYDEIVKLVVSPLQISAIGKPIGVPGIGFTVIVTALIIVAPVQIPFTGVKLKLIVPAAKGLVNANCKLTIPLAEVPFVTPPTIWTPVAVFICQLYIVATGLLIDVIITDSLLQITVLSATVDVMAGIGFTVTKICWDIPEQLPICGFTSILIVPFWNVLIKFTIWSMFVSSPLIAAVLTLLVVALQINVAPGTVLVNWEAIFNVPPLQIVISGTCVINCGVAETVTVVLCPIIGIVHPFKLALVKVYEVSGNVGETEITLLPETPITNELGVPVQVISVPGVPVTVKSTGIPAHVVVPPEIVTFVGIALMVTVASLESLTHGNVANNV